MGARPECGAHVGKTARRMHSGDPLGRAAPHVPVLMFPEPDAASVLQPRDADGWDYWPRGSTSISFATLAPSAMRSNEARTSLPARMLRTGMRLPPRVARVPSSTFSR